MTYESLDNITSRNEIASSRNLSIPVTHPSSPLRVSGTVLV